MTALFATDDITHLQARRLDEVEGFRITFRSVHTGWHHQLYRDGCLADVSETAEQRQFQLDAAPAPSRVAIVAVASEQRWTDFSAQLPEDHGRPDWVVEATMLQSLAQPAGTTASLHSDQASGQIDPAPLVEQAVWPDSASRWGWGEDTWGAGGFGLGGANAPGLGAGAFGAGPFGMDSQLIRLQAGVTTAGTHQFVLRATGPDGSHADLPLPGRTIYPPPAPPESVRAIGYDSDTRTVTLEIH